MVEVFKTDVNNIQVANRVLDTLHRAFPGYKANFDLQDCDRILRIKSIACDIDVMAVIRILEEYGFSGSVLEDVLPASHWVTG